ncbi:MAG: phosphatase 2C-like domain-containing protein [Olpidium bornovanus]|uniref:Phosphatase 2C-like domain-containing protein n=1 Tax=Olpidium bornovanus TaxID=278681 RepID=A0A8H7ZJ82_9FUNG|nr:MAG: phosphatase 2C-like domain-containing protein [Olpidium bornovanus]
MPLLSPRQQQAPRALAAAPSLLLRRAAALCFASGLVAVEDARPAPSPPPPPPPPLLRPSATACAGAERSRLDRRSCPPVRGRRRFYAGRVGRAPAAGNDIASPRRITPLTPRRALLITSSAGICGGGLWYYWNGRSKPAGAGPVPAPVAPIDKPALFAGAQFADIAVASKTNPRILRFLLLKPEHVDAKLRRNESSVSVATAAVAGAAGAGASAPAVLVSRWDVAQVNSNEPVEDAHAEYAVVEEDAADCTSAGAGTPAAKRYMWGIFDGHSGFHCSRKVWLRRICRLKLLCSPPVFRTAISDFVLALTVFHGRHILLQVAAALPVYCAAALEKVDNQMVSEASEKPLVASAALKSAFVALDEEIIRGGLVAMASDPGRASGTHFRVLLAGISYFLAPATSGSCALVAHLDVATQDLYVAWAGDSRAVLGRQNATGEVTAVQLSWDHTGRDHREIARIRAEHPGEEETAVYRGRVLGNLEPTRSFGDARYKWDIKTSKMISGIYHNREIPRHYLTPPYVTARPDVTHLKLTAADKFLVLATDGLYDELTNDEIVALVTGWMRKRGKLPAGPSGPLETGRDPNSEYPRPSIPTAAPDRKWAYVDDNAATHLIRNALGGADTDTLAQVLSIPAPHSRRFRDDITVTVVFFEEASKSKLGAVTGTAVRKLVIRKDELVTVEDGNEIPKARL